MPKYWGVPFHVYLNISDIAKQFCHRDYLLIYETLALVVGFRYPFSVQTSQVDVCG